jgi:hypothetical protein
MRLPRMTTRRWMIAVGALSLTLGVYREATRLKRYRDELLARTARHVEAETYYRRLVSSSESSVLVRKMAVQDVAAQESVSDAERYTTLDNALDRWIALSEGRSDKTEEDDQRRFREAQSRVVATAARGRMIMDNYRRSQVEYHQRLAEYHAALGRKYAAAAARPWFPVSSDPPPPKHESSGLEPSGGLGLPPHDHRATVGRARG